MAFSVRVVESRMLEPWLGVTSRAVRRELIHEPVAATKAATDVMRAAMPSTRYSRSSAAAMRAGVLAVKMRTPASP